MDSDFRPLIIFLGTLLAIWIFLSLYLEYLYLEYYKARLLKPRQKTVIAEPEPYRHRFSLFAVQSARDRQMVSRFGYSRLTCLLQSNLLGWRDSVFCLHPLCRTPRLIASLGRGAYWRRCLPALITNAGMVFTFTSAAPATASCFHASLPPRPPQPVSRGRPMGEFKLALCLGHRDRFLRPTQRPAPYLFTVVDIVRTVFAELACSPRHRQHRFFRSGLVLSCHLRRSALRYR
jgi:hypothetical protein